MDIVHVADVVQEILQVILLGKTGQLRYVVEPNVNQTFGPRLPQEIEEPGCGNLGETYGVNFSKRVVPIIRLRGWFLSDVGDSLGLADEGIGNHFITGSE